MIIDLRKAAREASPSLPVMPHLTESAVATWRGRMVNEYTSATVFENLARQLEAANVENETVQQCRGFADEERRHGILCGAVVEALGGEARFTLPETDAFPDHADVSPVEAAVRNLLSISCLSETIAVSLIGAERLEMPEGELRELLTTIYADEVGHARFGWRLAARLVKTLDHEAIARLGEYLAVALGHLEAHELAHLNPHAAPPSEGASLGLCNGADARTLFYATVAEVILPGLEDIGLAAHQAWANRHPLPSAA
jgi:hypothetical protein